MALEVMGDSHAPYGLSIMVMVEEDAKRVAVDVAVRVAKKDEADDEGADGRKALDRVVSSEVKRAVRCIDWIGSVRSG